MGIFLFNLTVKCCREKVFERAAALTLRVLLAFFPFLVFLMALLGFLELDTEAVFRELYSVFPEEIAELAEGFIAEFSETRSAGILSTALFFSVFNTVKGFRAILRAANFRSKVFLPGAAFVLIGWLILSAAFGFFTRNFSQFPAIYGSIAGVFLLILWLNAVSVIFLIGNEINALLNELTGKERGFTESK